MTFELLPAHQPQGGYQVLPAVTYPSGFRVDTKLVVWSGPCGLAVAGF